MSFQASQNLISNFGAFAPLIPDRILGRSMPDIEKVKTYLATRGIEVWQYGQPTQTADLAAVAVGCGAVETFLC